MAKSGFDPRKLMELAVEVMGQSIHEPRRDGKASPLVGAVLLKPDGKIETAYRGELREGDHAEFTLLERKNRDARLDGAILFATLEPCAPAARVHPKLGCAERIVQARIREVWIGIEDPDPTVDRKGIAYLQQSGVTVHMFDRDLQEVIRTRNETFIAQASERAQAAAEEPTPLVLTKFEKPEPSIAIGDLSRDALERYIKDAGIPDTVGSETFNRRLLHQGLAKALHGNLVPTGYGILLFASEPRLLMPQAGLLATVHYPNGQTETQDFEGPMVLIPEQVEHWLKGRVPNIIIRTGMQRRERSVIPFELLREPIINALVHRDYEIAGAKCQLILSPESIRVMSPGGPPPPITLEQLQSFTAPTLSRNPQLHYVFSQMGLAEERGLGMKALRSIPESLGLPLPKYSIHEPYLTVQLYSSPESVVATIEPSAMDALNEDEKTGWRYLTSRVTTTMPEYASALNFDSRKAQRQLKKFVDLGLLRRMGKGRASRYEVTAP